MLPFSTLRRRAATIESEEALRASIEAHEGFVQANPRHRDALESLANQWLLMGTAYTRRRDEKRRAFLRAMSLSEQAMRTNPAFDQRVGSGESPWEACDSLGREEMDAMLFWVTGVLYVFREGMVFPQHIAHLDWLERADRMLERMKTIDRTWNGGAVLFSQAIVYHSVPESAGGDPEKARLYLEEALAYSEGWMLCRWGRAKYFLTDPKDAAARRAELQAVVATPPGVGEAPYWRRFFRDDARRMLDEMKL